MTNQYIELYKQHGHLINKSCSPLLNAQREEAIELFESMGFPPQGSEDYLHTDLSALFSLVDYGMNIARFPIPVNPYNAFRCDVPNLSTQLYFVVNDAFYTRHSPKAPLPKGVWVGGLNAFAAEHPTVMLKHYNTTRTSGNHAARALNTAFTQDGFVLYVPKGVVIEKPIQLVSLLRGDVDMLVSRRILIIIEEQAEAKLLVCDHTMDERHFLANQVTEVFVGRGAHFDLYELEETNTTTRRISSTYVEQEADSSVVINGLTLFNGQTRNNYHLSLLGEGAEATLSGMAILDKEQRVDTHLFVDHTAPRCVSNQLFKYILDDRSHGAFSGRVMVRPNAQKTQAYQSNKNLCLSSGAKMYTKPQLEIYADDVKCSHGATVGQLDEAALFYMRSRGLSEHVALMLLKFAFTNDVIETIRLDALKDRLKQLVEKRFKGELTKCASCGVCK